LQFLEDVRKFAEAERNYWAIFREAPVYIEALESFSGLLQRIGETRASIMILRIVCALARVAEC
jgi:hypothetical protein